RAPAAAAAPATVYDSTHAVTAEGQVAIAPFTPTSATRLTTGTVTVAVADGRLTLRPQNGINPKTPFVTVAPATDPVASTLPMKVDFGAPTSTPAAGNVLDYGERFSDRGSNSYGWAPGGAGEPADRTRTPRPRA